MSRLDDRLTTELERIARPADPTQVFERVDRRRSRLHIRRRIESAGLVVVVLLGTIGGFMFLSDAFRDGGTDVGDSVTPTPSPTITTTPGPIDMGLGFPVCNVRNMSADFDGNSTTDTASVATKMSDAGGCPAPGNTTEVLVVDLDDDGKADAVGGPLACPTGCEPFAAPDVDGNGFAEIAIDVERPGDGTKRIQLWDLITPPGGSLAMIPFLDGNGDPATFTWGTVENWGGSGPEKFGVSCTSRTSPPLVTEWQAIPTGPDSWHISEHGYHVVGTELRSAFEDSYDVPGEETVFPDGGGDTMCGAPVSSVSPAPTTDLGLGFPACNIRSIKGQFDGTGAVDTAYVYTKISDVGGCPQADTTSNILGVDLTGDGQIDAEFGPIGCELDCMPFMAIDLDDDGNDELLVQQAGGTVLRLVPYDIAGFGDVAADGPGIGELVVAPPGDPENGLVPGGPVSFSMGGDEGFSASLDCRGSGVDRVLVATTGELDSIEQPTRWTIHRTTFRLGNQGFEVLDTETFDRLVKDVITPGSEQETNLCGIPFPPNPVFETP